MNAWWTVLTSLLSGSIIPAIFLYIGNASTSGVLIEMLGGVTKNKFDTTLEQISNKVATNKSNFTLPMGLIAAFDSDKCPSDWEYFSSSGGRFLVGAGRHSNRSLSVYELRNTGGAETVVLSISQIPAHKHNFAVLDKGLGGFEMDGTFPANVKLAHRVSESSSVGGGQPIENRPPYVAVTFCKFAPSK